MQEKCKIVFLYMKGASVDIMNKQFNYFMSCKQRIHKLHKMKNCNMSDCDTGHKVAISALLAFCLVLSTYLSYLLASFLKLLQLIVTLTYYTEQGWYLVSCVHSGKQVELAERNPPQQQQVSLLVMHL